MTTQTTCPCRQSTRWLVESCKIKLVPAIERLAREKDPYVAEALAALQLVGPRCLLGLAIGYCAGSCWPGLLCCCMSTRLLHLQLSPQWLHQVWCMTACFGLHCMHS
jgi:hypothetical protein